MSRDLGRLLYRIDGDMRPFDAKLGGAEAAFVGSAGRMSTAGVRLSGVVRDMSGPFVSLARVVLPLAGAAGFVALARGAIATASSFEQLGLRLETVEGSAQKAKTVRTTYTIAGSRSESRTAGELIVRDQRSAAALPGLL